MVNIKKFISSIKGDAVSDAKKLQAARKERLKLEGRAKLVKQRSSEEARIKKAKADLKYHSKPAKFGRAVKGGLKNIKEEIKANKTSKKSNSPWNSNGKDKNNDNPWR